jgi:ABC-type antimicrobial peptide transport system permease subunit
VMIVSASTARQLFGTRDPIGRAVPLPILTGQPGRSAPAPVTVVGVVDDVKYSGIETPPNAVIYRPFAQQPWPSMFIVVRTSDETSNVAPSLRREIAAVDPSIGVMTIDTLDGFIANAVAQPRFRAIVLVSLSALAIALAGVGLYGVVSYMVAQRTAEIGIRLAVGAGQGHVIRLVLREGLWMATTGIIAGAIAARALTGVIAGLLYGVPATDPVSYGGGATLLLTLTLLACYVPARRASRIDPLTALRQE